MTAFLLAAALFILATAAAGLARVLRGPGDADRMMAMQLLGTGGIGTLLLMGMAEGMAGVIDVALTLALLAAIAAIAFARLYAVASPSEPSGHRR